MPRKEILDRIQKYVQPFRITKGKGFRLKKYDPGSTCGLKLDKGESGPKAKWSKGATKGASEGAHKTPRR
jgi:hypothetical protein